MPETRYRVGDRVRFRMPLARMVEGVVKEDIGPIGRGGRRLYGITFPAGLHVEEPGYIELGAADLELVPAPRAAD